VFRQLGLRPLLRKDEHGEVLKIDLDGKETRALITDMCKLSTPGGRSELLEAVRAARTELGLSMAGMDGWTACLMHWGTAMRAGYVLRATDADRLAFRSHARWYVLKKALLVEKLVWYDLAALVGLLRHVRALRVAAAHLPGGHGGPAGDQQRPRAPIQPRRQRRPHSGEGQGLRRAP
jgi:hypothetical protein